VAHLSRNVTDGHLNFKNKARATRPVR